jgi:hypothetical protein
MIKNIQQPSIECILSMVMVMETSPWSGLDLYYGQPLFSCLCRTAADPGETVEEQPKTIAKTR